MGKFAELIALFRANQRIQMRPVLQRGAGFFYLQEQRLLLLAILFILFQLLAQLALAFAVFTQLAGNMLELRLGICQR